MTRELGHWQCKLQLKKCSNPWVQTDTLSCRGNVKSICFVSYYAADELRSSHLAGGCISISAPRKQSIQYVRSMPCNAAM